MTMTVTVADLDSLLALDGEIDANRAQLLIDLAIERCQVEVMPLPDNARGIVLTVAARAYLNPTGIASETVGPNSVQFGSSGVGIFLSAVEEAVLQKMSGRGGAFTIDMTPEDALAELFPWDINAWGSRVPSNNSSLNNGVDGIDLGNWQ